MKNLLLFISCCCFCCFALFSFSKVNSNSPVQEKITFHQVNLVCNAADDLGCGSRSKPILFDLEKEEGIKEAWLNRNGTITAVVWADNFQPKPKLVSSIFKKHGKSIETLAGDKYQKQLASFKSEKWYHGAEVDELSMEEAGRIANQIVDPLVTAGILPKEDASKMHAEVEAFIGFVKKKDVSLLDKASFYNGWNKEIKKIGEKYVGEGNMPIMEMRTSEDGSSCCTDKKEESCTKEQSSCCTKPGNKSGS